MRILRNIFGYILGLIFGFALLIFALIWIPYGIGMHLMYTYTKKGHRDD